MPMDPSSPYLNLPPEAFWNKSVALVDSTSINPHVKDALKIKPHHKIASAGSCFAHRISESLIKNGFNYMVVENGPAFLSEAERQELSYGVFSARFGNIYTPIQLLQTFQRAFGEFQPVEPLWKNSNGLFVDPFRPGIQSFETEEACLRDREIHLRAVKELFTHLDILIYTMGVTESWFNKEDGAVFPVCPGSGLGGQFDPKHHGFHNYSASEVTDHLVRFVEALKKVNPNAHVILTISPMPIIATFEPRHIVQATTYSKSVLRVACEEVRKKYDHVHYFAAYEIVTAMGNNHLYFEKNKRDIALDAIPHIMHCFNQQFIDTIVQPKDKVAPLQASVLAEKTDSTKKPMCDEESILSALAIQEEEK